MFRVFIRNGYSRAEFLRNHSYLLYDVEIGDNVIIGAGSLVNKNVLSNSVVAGVPCKVIGSFEEYKKKIKNSSTERKRG